MRRSRHGPVYPPSIQLNPASEVLAGNKDFGLKSAQGVGAGRMLFQSPVVRHRLHRGVTGQPYRIVGVLISCQPTVDRLPQQRYELTLHIPATSRLP